MTSKRKRKKAAKRAEDDKANPFIYCKVCDGFHSLKGYCPKKA